MHLSVVDHYKEELLKFHQNIKVNSPTNSANVETGLQCHTMKMVLWILVRLLPKSFILPSSLWNIYFHQCEKNQAIFAVLLNSLIILFLRPCFKRGEETSFGRGGIILLFNPRIYLSSRCAAHILLPIFHCIIIREINASRLPFLVVVWTMCIRHSTSILNMLNSLKWLFIFQ